jgi:LysR family transcriptional activator of glutamate synthase operon
MELLQLQYFYDAARNESFAKTAEKYMVPASSVSASIKRLEGELGCKLFDRHSNRITLNENGKRLQRSVGIIFDELDRIRSELGSAESEGGTVRLLIRTIRNEITDAIISYRKSHPAIVFETVFDMSEENTEPYDIIIDEHTDKYEGYRKFELYSARVRIRASLDSPLAGRTLTMSQLRHQPFVTMGKGSNLHKILIRACKNAGFTPNIVMETNDAKCYGKCISGGMGIGLGRERTRPSNVAPNSVYLKVIDFDERQTFYGYYKDMGVGKHILEFIDFLRKWEF